MAQLSDTFFPWDPESPPPSVPEFTTPLNDYLLPADYNQLMTTRQKEGFLIQHVFLSGGTDGKPAKIHVKMTLLWAPNVLVEYRVKAIWDAKSGEKPPKIDLSLSAWPGFLAAYVQKQSTPSNQLLVHQSTKLHAFVSLLLDTDRLVAHIGKTATIFFLTNPQTPLHYQATFNTHQPCYTVPGQFRPKAGQLYDVVDLQLKTFTGLLISATSSNRNEQQFSSYWQVIANLVPNKLSRWFDEIRFEVILRPTPKDDHPNNFELQDTQLSRKSLPVPLLRSTISPNLLPL